MYKIKDDPQLKEHNEKLLAECKDKVMTLLKRSIRPEFLNRIDEIIMFRPLGKEEIRGILKLQISQVEKMLEAQDVKLNFTEKALNWLSEKGFDIAYGARPIKRLLQKEVINAVAREIISGKISRGSTVKIDVKDSVLTINGTPTAVE